MIRIATVWRARGELRFLPLWAKTVTEAAFPLRCRDGGRRGTSLTEGLLISPAPLPPSSGGEKALSCLSGLPKKSRQRVFRGEAQKRGFARGRDLGSKGRKNDQHGGFSCAFGAVLRGGAFCLRTLSRRRGGATTDRRLFRGFSASCEPSPGAERSNLLTQTRRTIKFVDRFPGR